jgi:hypothetical protein
MLIKMLEMPMARVRGAGVGITGMMFHILFSASILKGSYLTITAHGSS